MGLTLNRCLASLWSQASRKAEIEEPETVAAVLVVAMKGIGWSTYWASRRLGVYAAPVLLERDTGFSVVAASCWPSLPSSSSPAT